MLRRFSYAQLGAGLSFGAPLGLCLLRSVRAGMLSGAWLEGEIRADGATYAYVLVSTLVAFSTFGFILGRQADRLAHLSRTDVLTGLRNRRYFQERLEEEFARASRYGHPLSLLLIDVDRLKQVNDRHGHKSGDLALGRAAAAIRTGSRAGDIGARWGGDEFALLAPNTGRPEALSVAERVRSLASSPAGPAGEDVVTVSVGVATFDPQASAVRSPEALVGVADAALYEAKRAGRDRVAG
jgi:diguanylate cyclase (GGDEF)-like protein